MDFGYLNYAKIDAKTSSKMGWFFDWFLKVFRIRKGSPNGYEKGARSDHFLEYFRVHFRHDFLIPSWAAGTSILVFSCRPRAFFHIFTMSKKVSKMMPKTIQNWCLWDAKNVIKNRSKNHSKNLWFLVGFWGGFWITFGSKIQWKKHWFFYCFWDGFWMIFGMSFGSQIASNNRWNSGHHFWWIFVDFWTIFWLILSVRNG